ncbi:MAG: ABC transporter ATP-binding protein [Sedimentisphaerales bacterium]|nr:ABC transporter ATP-binding protein [Sedimentisphaerales bacterium]
MSDKQQNPVIQTMGLAKVFRDFWGHQKVIAVDDLNLEVRPREVFGLLGPNGSGKSTTIKMLLGLLYPTRGRARVLGNSPGDIKTNAYIGYLPEESYLYPFLNANETLDFYGRLFGLPRQQRRKRIDSLLEMVGLASAVHRPIGEYSKGMIRRIGLAQALINDPDLLILDEPTAGLDPIGTRQIKDLVRELGKRGKTVLLCSHLLADVEDVCDRICILYGGKVQAEGTVEEMLTRGRFTQIVSPSLSKQTLNKIEKIIQHECPKDDQQITVSTPRDKLEDVFLHIVAKAQAAEVETSGATMGAGVSDFLTSATPLQDESTVVIEQLVSPQQPTVDTTETETQSEPIKTDTVRQDVLESLVESSDEIAARSAPPTSNEKRVGQSPTLPVDAGDVKENETKDSSVDRSVIDGLLGDEK